MGIFFFFFKLLSIIFAQPALVRFTCGVVESHGCHAVGFVVQALK